MSISWEIPTIRIGNARLKLRNKNVHSFYFDYSLFVDRLKNDMTSNGSEEVNQTQNQTNQVQNGMKCADSMPSAALSTSKRSNRNNNMGLKRVRSVDSIAGKNNSIIQFSFLTHFRISVGIINISQSMTILNLNASFWILHTYFRIYYRQCLNLTFFWSSVKPSINVKHPFITMVVSFSFLFHWFALLKIQKKKRN